MEIKSIKFCRKKRITTTSLFFLAYGLFLFLVLTSTTFYFQYIMGAIYQIGISIAMALLIFREFFYWRYNCKNFKGIIICLILMLLVYVADASNRNIIMVTILFIYCARNIEFEKIASFSAKLSTFFLVFVILSSFAGVIQNYSTFSGGRARNYIGFLYALFPSTILCNITMLRIYLKKEKIAWTELAVLSVANFWIYYQTKSRLSYGISLATIALAVALKLLPKVFENKKWFRNVLASAPGWSALLSITLTAFYSAENTFLVLIDLLLDGRISMAKNAMKEYGISLFGTKFSMIGNGLDAFGNNLSKVYLTYSYIDNLYVQLILRYGLIFFLLFICLFMYVSYRAVKYDVKGYLSIIFALLALQGMIQDSFLNIAYNTFIFLFGSILINEVKKYSKQSIAPECEHKENNMN